MGLQVVVNCPSETVCPHLVASEQSVIGLRRNVVLLVNIPVVLLLVLLVLVLVELHVLLRGVLLMLLRWLRRRLQRNSRMLQRLAGSASAGLLCLQAKNVSTVILGCYVLFTSVQCLYWAL